MRSQALSLFFFVAAFQTLLDAEPQDQQASSAAPSFKSSERVVVFPFRRATVSAEVDAAVKSIPFKEGERVKAGDIILELDERRMTENLQKASASLLEAEAGDLFAKKAFEQAQELEQRGGAGKQELEKARLDKDMANAKLAYAKSLLSSAKIDLESCKVKAPYAGRIVKRIVSEGEYVKAGQPLLEIVDDTKLLAVANLPSSDSLRLKNGDEAKIRIDETGSEVSGPLYENSGRVNPAGRTIETKYLIDNSSGAIVPGMSGIIVSRRSSSRAAEPKGP